MNIVVTGPESSGTRFVARWIDSHPDLIGRHWSMPSGERWMRHWPTDHDFDGEPPHAVILCIRSFQATIASQLHHGRAETVKESEENITQAHLRTVAWSRSHGIPIYFLTYDTVTARPETFEHVFEWLGVEPVPCPEEVIPANDKWLR